MVFVKRWWFALVLVLTLLAGCGGAAPTQVPTEPPTAPVAQATALPPTDLPTAKLPVPPTAGPVTPTAAPTAPPTTAPSGGPIPALALIDNNGKLLLVDGDERTELASIDPLSALSLSTCQTNTDLAWSPDGHRLAFANGILTLGADPALAPLTGYLATWSPDGQKLAYITGLDDADELTLGEADGINPQRIASAHWSTTGRPHWSPDGKQVVAGPMLRLEDASSSAVTPPAEFGNNGLWSPDGRYFVWMQPEGDENVLRLRVKRWDGVEATDLTVLQYDRDPGFAADQIWWTDPGWTLPPLTWIQRNNLVFSLPRAGLRNVPASIIVEESGRYGPFGDEQLTLCDIAPDGKMMLGQRISDGHIIAFDAITRTTIADLGAGITARWRPTPQGPVPPAPLAAASPTLSLADPRLEGPAVTEVQTILRDLGYLETVDGIYGPDTEAAVRAFQKRNRLDEDGVVGPETWITLRHLPCSANNEENNPYCEE